MAGALRYHTGGIKSLASFLTEHGEAIEYDLITRAGVSIRDIPEKLDWGGLRSFLMYLPPQSALGVELYPENKWSQTEYFLADLVDSLQGLIWSLGGGKGSKPKPIKRPGKKEAKVLEMTPEEFREKWSSVEWNEEVS